MSTVKIKFRPSSVEGREGTIFFQIIKNRKVRQIYTEYHVFPEEWDHQRNTLAFRHNSLRSGILLAIRERLRCDMARINRIIRMLDQGNMTYEADDIVVEFEAYSRQYTVFNYMESLITKMKCNHKTGTADTYRSALNSFKKFREGTDLLLDCISADTMERYEAWLSDRGIIPNTISFYMRILRATYNRAVEEDIIEDRRPFRHVYTGVDKTVKRALPLPDIGRIKNMNLTFSPSLDYARDMFMMSFYLRGMSFVDMAFLRKSDLREGYITYRRRKTGRMLIIAWTKEMQTILDKYPQSDSGYLLPIIRNETSNRHYTYRNAAYNINRSLKKIGKKMRLTGNITMYVARHSWASAAKSKGIPLGVISEGMGHDSETTTRIYLASLETSVVDTANSLIISSI